MRAVLYATLAKAELSKKLSAVLGNDLKVVDTPDQLAAEIPEADALFMGDMLYAGKTREAIMTTAKKLKWIQILTAGYDNAKQFGVPPGVQVTNVGDALAPAVGLHAHVVPYRLEDANRALDDLRTGRFDGTAVLQMGHARV